MREYNYNKGEKLNMLIKIEDKTYEVYNIPMTKYIIEVYKGESEVEIWLSNNDYGVKIFVLGLEKDAYKDIDLNSIDFKKEIEIYEKNYITI